MGRKRDDVKHIDPFNTDSFGNRKGERKQAHRFTGVAAQKRAARKARNIRKSK